MQCPRCQGENLADASFCQHCGEKLALICVSCQSSNTADSKFCRKCGTRLGAQSRAPSASAGPAVAPDAAAAADPYVPAHLAERFRLGHAALLSKHVGERKIITALFA